MGGDLGGDSMNLLEKGGIKEKPTSITPLSGGANNRVYRLEFQERDPLIQKHYFTHPGDTRPRLQAEYAFLSYAWEEGLRQIPKPLAADEANGEALYTSVPGSAPQKVTEAMVDQALSFFLSLNQGKKRAKHLPLASEHCLTIQDYLSTVEKKLSLFQTLPPKSPFYPELSTFLQKKLLPRWKKVQKELALDPTETIPPEDLCLTPSDFGFHNALIDQETVYFLDFEYAGWDDPTKTACDFFCQPKCPVPIHLFEKVTTTIASTTQNPPFHLKRMKAMLPVCQIKWCCIVLNVFQKIGSERRRFSDPHLLETCEEKLFLAEHLLERLN